MENIIDSKACVLVRKFYSEATLQMSKLAKKVIDLKKLPNKVTRVMEGAYEKRARKKEKRQQTRKEKKVLFHQQNQKSTRQESNHGHGSRGGSRQGRGNQSRHHSTGGRVNGGERGNVGGNRNTPTRTDSAWPPLGNYDPVDVRTAFRPNITGLRPLPITTNTNFRRGRQIQGWGVNQQEGGRGRGRGWQPNRQKK